MSEQTQSTGPGTDIDAADLDVDVDRPAAEGPATSDPDAFVDDGLGMGDGPDVTGSGAAG